MPMLTMSVAVVRKMLDAVAGSKPSRRSVSGMIAPEMPPHDARARHGGYVRAVSARKM